MQTCVVEITNRHGLHARACAKIVHVASQFRCNVALVSGVRRASAHSIVAVMLLAAAVGSNVRVETDGPDELAAMDGYGHYELTGKTTKTVADFHKDLRPVFFDRHFRLISEPSI